MYKIEQLIPHRPPMILIDELINYDENSAECRVDISENIPFFDSNLGGVPAHVGIEYMAQTIAAFAGARSLELGDDIEVGFLLGSRKYRCHKNQFNSGESLSVRVAELHREESGLGVFDCAIVAQGEVLAEARINVFQPENASQYVNQAKEDSNGEEGSDNWR